MKVKVIVLTLMRYDFLKECLKRLFINNNGYYDVDLISQGDNSHQLYKIANYYIGREDFRFRFTNRKSPSIIKNMLFKESLENGYDLVITVDDDLMLKDNLINLIDLMEREKDYHAISGYIIENCFNKMLGGKIKYKNNVGYYKSFLYKENRMVRKCDFISGGLTAYRLEPLVYYDENYKLGYIDWDYSNRITMCGLNIGTSYLVGGYHKMMNIGDKWFDKPNNFVYNEIRRNKDTISNSRELFYKNWGYYPEYDMNKNVYNIRFRRKLFEYMPFLDKGIKDETKL